MFNPTRTLEETLAYFVGAGVIEPTSRPAEYMATPEHLGAELHLYVIPNRIMVTVHTFGDLVMDPFIIEQIQHYGGGEFYLSGPQLERFLENLQPQA